MTWDFSVRAVISEHAQQNGGGNFSLKFGTWRTFSVLLESFAYNLFVQLLSIGTEAGSARVEEIKYCLLIVSIGMLVKICLYVDLLLFL